MKKKELIQSIKIIVLGLVLSMGISFVYASVSKLGGIDLNVIGPGGGGAQPFDPNGGGLLPDPNDPPPPPGGGNTPTYSDFGPLNVGSSFQTKLGNLSVAGNEIRNDGIVASNLITGFLQINPLAGGGERRLCATSNGTLKACSAGVCGTATVLSSTPNTSTPNLCSFGSPSNISGTGPWTWVCNGTGGPTTCSADVPPVCGTANGGSFYYYTNYAQTLNQWLGQNLCTKGVAVNLVGGNVYQPAGTYGINPGGYGWRWQCSSAGTTVGCGANLKKDGKCNNTSWTPKNCGSMPSTACTLGSTNNCRTNSYGNGLNWNCTAWYGGVDDPSTCYN